MADLTPRSLALLTAVHNHPGITRARVTGVLGLSSGAITEQAALLTRAGVLAETPVAPDGPGRPTTSLGAGPRGPLIAVASIRHRSWLVEVQELGGATVASLEARHSGDAAAMIRDLSGAVRTLRRRFPDRVRALGLAVAGTSSDQRHMSSSRLGWYDIDLAAIWHRAPILLVENNANCAAVAEAAHGAGAGADVCLYLRLDAALGGAVVDHGTLIVGATGLAGEFGHLPFGDRSVQCPCGAFGCWGTEVDPPAFAALLGERRPREPERFLARTLERAAGGDALALAACYTAATALGRGIAGLVHVIDPDVIVLGGHAPALLAVATRPLLEAYRGGLMRARLATPPPLVADHLGDTAIIVGIASRVWPDVLAALQL